MAGIVPGPLPDQWFLSAANILAGDVSVIQRAFVDASHGAGFYAVRFFVEDPSSDDDWAVVLVDDRLPCGADGKPCFARSPVEGVLWASILEKAFAKFRGSYEAIHAGGGASAEEGLTFLTGGLAKEVDLTTADGAAALAGGGGARWQQLMEAWGSGHVIGCRHKSVLARRRPSCRRRGWWRTRRTASSSAARRRRGSSCACAASWGGPSGTGRGTTRTRGGRIRCGR